MKRVLILGATGFVGRNFLETTKDYDEFEFICTARQKFANLIQSPNIKWLYGDLENEDFLKEIFLSNPELILNFFWKGLPTRTNDLNDLNYLIQCKLIERVKSNGSTIYSFGSGLEFIAENMPKSDNSSSFSSEHFALTKRKLHSYLMEKEVNHIWIRPFYIYGRWQNPKSLLGSIIISYLNGKEFSSNNLDQVHDFTAISDLMKAMHYLIKNKPENKEFNVGSGRLVSVKNFIYATNLALRNIDFFQDEQKLETYGIYSGNNNLYTEFGWTPEFSGSEGIYNYVRAKKEELLNCFRTQ